MSSVRTSMRVSVLLLWLAIPAGGLPSEPVERRAGRAPDEEDVLARAASHVERYAAALPYLVAEETMTQRLTPRHGREGQPATRRLVSDFGWVQLDGITEPLGLREVRSVDWEPVGPLAQLGPLLDGSRRGTTAQARALLNAGARYNLAPGSRNVNIPTFAFFFLLPDWQSRFSWKREGSAKDRIWEFSFTERERPTVIRTASGKPVHSRGRIWVDPDTGTILRTVLETKIERDRYRLEVEFAAMPDVGLTVPTSMVETFGGDTFVVEGRATYRNYRRFTTGARLVH